MASTPAAARSTRARTCPDCGTGSPATSTIARVPTRWSTTRSRRCCTWWRTDLGPQRDLRRRDRIQELAIELEAEARRSRYGDVAVFDRDRVGHDVAGVEAC